MSYSRDDRVAVEGLAADLTRFGREVWLDERLEGGADWWEEILERIRGCTAFLFVISEGSASSRPCRNELTYALALNRVVLPIALRADLEGTLPVELAGRHVVSYREGSKDEVADLLRALTSLDDARPLPDPLPPAPELPASPYGRLRDEVRADQLDADQQEMVLRRIRELWTEKGGADRVLVLLDELRHRPDLLASIVPEVDALTMEIAADRAPASRRRRGLDRWERLGRAWQAGVGLGTLSLAAAAIAQLSNDLYESCNNCTYNWGESSDVSRWQYLVLAGVVIVGLVMSLGGRAMRAGGIVVLGAGVAMLTVMWSDINEITGYDDGLSRLGGGLWWTMFAGLLAVVAGTILVVRSEPIADDRSPPARN